VARSHLHQAAPGELRLQVRLLGQFAMAVDGCPVAESPSGRLQSLLAFLLLHAGEPQSRAQLSFVFWPDAPEANARNNLRQLLHQLRHLLPAAGRFLHADAQTVQWAREAPLDLDVALFEAALADSEAAARAGDTDRKRVCLERALDLCQGPLVPSCYDDWIGAERDRLARRCEDAAAALVALLEQQREYAAAVDRVRHWLQHDPLDEEAYRWLMRLLALAGDRPAALQAYRQCTAALGRELGAQPSAATRRLHEQIRSVEATVPEPATAGEEAATLPLVGRQAEWSRLRSAWERAAQGRVTFALVSGDAGIGKSRLAEELLTWARRQGVAAARTRSYAAEGSLSLAPVSEWLRSDALSPQLARLEDVWHLEVARIVPELLAARPALPPPAPMTDFGDRLRFFEGLARAVLLAPPPLLLLIDDLQWCDRETIEWLHFLSRFEPAAALLVLGTMRSEEPDPGHPLPELLRDLRGRSQLVEIALEPLDAAETAALAGEVAQTAIDVAAATRLYRETEGNPLFVVETVRAEGAGHSRRDLAAPAGSTGLSSRTQAVLAGRLAQLSEPTRQVAAAAAVIGRAFSLAVLARLVGGEDAAVTALDELWRRRIVREQGPDVYDFTHDRLREVAYGDTSTPQRRRLHRQVAEALVELHAEDLDPVSAAIAAHYDNGGLPAAAIPHYARAAVVAQAVYAHEEAVALGQRALALVGTLPPGVGRDGQELELHLLLAPSCRVTMGWAAAELGALLERALALCDRVGTSAQRVEALYGMQSSCVVAGRLEESARLAEELEHGFPGGGAHAALQPSFAMMAGVRVQMGRFQEACDHIDRLLGDVDPSQLQRFLQSQGVNYEIHTRSWQSHALWCLGRPDTAFARASHALQLARRLGQPFSQAIAATYLALLQQLRADTETFAVQAEQALELATRFKATYYRAWAGILVAYAGALAHPEADGLGRLRGAIDGFRQTGARLRLPYYLALLADLELRAGSARAGLEVVEAAQAHSRETGERWWDSELHRLRAELLLADGARPADAEPDLVRALEIAREQQARSLELRAARSLAALRARSGHAKEARDLLAPVCAAFSEGLDTPDVKAAFGLLARLSSADGA